jgi:hypothetical protein
MYNEYLKVTGAVTITLTDEHGNTKPDEHGNTKPQEKKNLVVTSGLSFLAASLVGVITPFSYIAAGSGVTTAALGNTALETELGRVATTTATSTGPVVTFVAVLGAGVATGAITEAGIFNAATVGTMLSRVVFNVINKGAADTLTITWTVTLS